MGKIKCGETERKEKKNVGTSSKKREARNILSKCREDKKKTKRPFLSLCHHLFIKLETQPYIENNYTHLALLQTPNIFLTHTSATKFSSLIRVCRNGSSIVCKLSPALIWILLITTCFFRLRQRDS